MSSRSSPWAWAAVLAGVGLVGYELWKGGSAVLSAVNPTNANNLFAQASNAAASAVTGTETTAGGAVYSLTHGYVVESDGTIVSVPLSTLDLAGYILDPFSSYFGDKWYSTLADAQAAAPSGG